MKIDRFLKAALAGFAVAVASVPAAYGQGEVLRVETGQASSALRVPMNRAVVVSAEMPFAELSIANPNIADISTLSDRSIYVLGKAPGRTTLTLLGPDGGLITNVEVQVTPDTDEFKERIRQILPGENIEVRTANDGIVLSGVVSSIARLDRALELAERYAPGRVSNMMVVGGTQQVMLKVRFAEMQRSISKALTAGTNISVGDDGPVAALGPSVEFEGVDADGDANTPAVLTPLLIDQAGVAGQIFDSFEIGDLAFDVLLQALETKGLVRTLSEPNLVALSGQEASFLAGGEYPVPVVDDEGSISVEFKPFGIELTFTPRVVDRDIINLQLVAAVSDLDPTVVVQSGGFTINGFRRRETQTVVELRDGESFAISGLLEDDFQDTITQVPWLADVPVLGALFRSTDYERQQSELVVIVTPHLVTPTRGEALALPTDRVRIPTESELFLLGATGPGRNTTPQQGAAGEVARQDFNGSYGYVME
ncbi:MAG: type II and III secretion system protein family protein [Pseudomonadota bacterium]